MNTEQKSHCLNEVGDILMPDLQNRCQYRPLTTEKLGEAAK